MSEKDRHQPDGWSKRRVGEAIVVEEHGEPRVVEGARLAGAEARVQAIRVGNALGEEVWIRPAEGGLWRRGRVTVNNERVEFLDEASATEGSGRDVFPVTGEAMLEAAVLASAEVRAKVRRSEVYAALLYVGLAGRAWQNVSGKQAELSDRQAEGVVGSLTGRSFSRVAAYWAYAEIFDAKALDEEVVEDIVALGWTPVGVPDGFGERLLARKGKVLPGTFAEGPREAVEPFTAGVEADRAKETLEQAAAIDEFLRDLEAGEQGWRAVLAGLPEAERTRLEAEFARRVEQERDRLQRRKAPEERRQAFDALKALRTAGTSVEKVGPSLIHRRDERLTHVGAAVVTGGPDDGGSVTAWLVAGEREDAVWVRQVGSRGLRRGRVRITAGQVEFRDELDAAGPRPVIEPMQADMLSSAIPAKACANVAYAALLAKALRNRRWRRTDGVEQQWGLRDTGDFVGGLVGEGQDAFRFPEPSMVDGIDEEVASDLLSLGWTPAEA